MNKIITNILVPIQLEEEYLSVLKIAAEFAREHQATIHLLYIEPVSYNFRDRCVRNLLNPRHLYVQLKEKSVLMTTWKRYVEQEYGVQATCTADWGKRKKTILKYRLLFDADLVILKEQQIKTRWYNKLTASLNELIIKKSNCQVLTVFSEKNSLTEWTQIVIPVTNFIPHARILTIIKSVKAFHIKIHLIALPGNEFVESKSGFHFLTESLKFLKPYNNIQVECKYVNSNFNSLVEFIRYTKKVGADALLTNADTQEYALKTVMRNSNSLIAEQG